LFVIRQSTYVNNLSKEPAIVQKTYLNVLPVVLLLEIQMNESL